MRNGLRVLGGISCAIYLAIAILSLSFGDSIPGRERPLLAVLALLATACLVYLFALAWIARRGGRSAAGRSASSMFREVLLFSIVFRLVLLPSIPIQEVDFYRYLWDGRVLAHGLNPYEFSPAQIDHAGPGNQPQLSKFAAVRDASVTTRAIFEGVHHRHVATIYPPLAQVFFAACAVVTPAAAPLWIHLLVLRSLLLAVDIAILFAMRALLRHAGLADAWCLAYGWCPLAVKEVANSAHFDGLAVLGTLIGLLLLLRSAPNRFTTRATALSLASAGTFLGLAILTKSYPIILLPLFAAYALACGRMRGLLTTVASCVVVVVAGYAFLIGSTSSGELSDKPQETTATAQTQGPLAGLTVFLTRWQMNDLLFMVVHENLRVPTDEPQDRWFVLVPMSARHAANEHARDLLRAMGIRAEVDPGFVTTQAVMGILLGAILFWQAYRTFKQPEPMVLLRGAFLVLAWAWLVTSAQNPWYVLWFLPLIPFARAWSWYLLPCLALIYYLRFWLVFQGEWIASTGECPAFDYGWVWAEHGIVILALGLESLARHLSGPGRNHSGVSAAAS